MTLFFTEEEKKYIIIKSSGDYRLSCSERAPQRIKRSIEKKLNAHKKWLKECGGE